MEAIVLKMMSHMGVLGLAAASLDVVVARKPGTFLVTCCERIIAGFVPLCVCG